jgi:hypothetical protein
MNEFKVVCVREEVNYPQLKIGKHFTVTENIKSSYDEDLYILISDEGEYVNWIEYYYFKTLSELREERLKELGL